MIAAIELKKLIISTYIFCIIINKFGYKEKLSPVIWLMVIIKLKINLYNIVWFFGLVVNLKVENNGD